MMTKEQIEQDIRTIFEKMIGAPVEELGAPRITYSRWDSITHVRLLRQIEKSLGIRFSGEEAIAIRTVAELIEISKEKMNGS